MGIVELLKEVLSVALELHHALAIAHSALHLEDLAHYVKQGVIDVNHHNVLIVSAITSVVRVVNATCLQERVHGLAHRLHVFLLDDEAVVWVVVERNLLLLGEALCSRENVLWVVDAEVSLMLDTKCIQLQS